MELAMSDIQRALDKQAAMDAAATEGPWTGISAEESDNGYGYGNCLIITHDNNRGSSFSDADQALLAHLRNQAALARAVIEEAYKLLPKTYANIAMEDLDRALQAWADHVLQETP